MQKNTHNIGAAKYIQNIGASKIFGGCQIFGRCQILAVAKSLANAKSLADAKSLAAGKVGRDAEEPPNCLGSAESAAADFSQALLMVSYSSVLMC